MGRLLAFGVAWVPFWVRFTFHLPGFEPVFTRMDHLGLLPGLSRWVMRAGQLNEASFRVLPILCFALVLFADVRLASKAGTRRARQLYWVWFAGTIVLGVAATVILEVALLLPVFSLPAQVQ